MSTTLAARLVPAFWQRLPRAAVSWISPLVLLAAWAYASRQQWFPDQILVPPTVVLDAFREVWSSGELQDNMRISMTRLLLGFALGCGFGIAFGVLLATSARARSYLGPSFHALRQVPTLALTPMFILIFGIGETLKIVIIMKSTFFPVAIATLEGIRNVPRQFFEVGAVFRLGRFEQFRRIIFPATLPPILTGVRIALGRSWMVLVGVELLASDSGIGQMMEMGRQMLRLDTVMVCVIVTGLTGFIIDRGFRLLQTLLLRGRSA